MDGSHKIVVKVISQNAKAAKVHVFRTPRQHNAVAAIFARKLFTDGLTKCPVTCQDSDLLISQSCSELSDGGYCDGGSLTLRGQKLSIGLQVCPQTCGRCDDVMSSSSPEVSGSGSACEDANIKI